METQELSFTVTGTLSIPKNATLLYNNAGGIRGWLNAEGKEVLLILGLEVNEGEQYLCTSKEMLDIAGCDIIEYVETTLEDESE